MPSAKIANVLQRAAGEQVQQPEGRLVLGSRRERGDHGSRDARHRDVRTEAVQRDDREREQDLLAKVRDPEGVREGLEHGYSTVPPAASILARAAAETLSTLMVSFLVSSPSPRTLTGRVGGLDDALGLQARAVDDVAVGVQALEARRR